MRFRSALTSTIVLAGWSFLAIYVWMTISKLGSSNLGTTSISVNVAVLMLEIVTGTYGYFLYVYILGSSDKGYLSRLQERAGQLTSEDLAAGNEVTVAILAYKEPVDELEETMSHAAGLKYPKIRRRVLVYDDPEGVPAELKTIAEGLGFEVFYRGNRRGFKAGACNDFLETVETEFIFFLDADHQVKPMVVSELAPLLAGSPNVGFLQSRTLFRNIKGFVRGASHVLQTEFFEVLQRARSQWGGAMFAGSTALFRVEAIRSVAGFPEDTIADDTDISYLLHGAGWRNHYVPIWGSSGLVPWTIQSFLTQVWRWYNGLTRIFMLRWKMVFRSKASFMGRMDLLFTTLTPLIGFLTWVASVVLSAAIASRVEIVRPIELYAEFPVFLVMPTLLATGSMFLLLVSWARERSDFSEMSFSFIAFLPLGTAFYVLCLGVQPFIGSAVFAAFLRRRVVFRRTEKSQFGRIPLDSRVVIGLLNHLAGIHQLFTAYRSLSFEPSVSGLLFVAGIGNAIPLIVYLWTFLRSSASSHGKS